MKPKELRDHRRSVCLPLFCSGFLMLFVLRISRKQPVTWRFCCGCAALAAPEEPHHGVHQLEHDEAQGTARPSALGVFSSVLLWVSHVVRSAESSLSLGTNPWED